MSRVPLRVDRSIVQGPNNPMQRVSKVIPTVTGIRFLQPARPVRGIVSEFSFLISSHLEFVNTDVHTAPLT